MHALMALAKIVVSGCAHGNASWSDFRRPRLSHPHSPPGGHRRRWDTTKESAAPEVTLELLLLL
jgi:hypothetical protein